MQVTQFLNDLVQKYPIHKQLIEDINLDFSQRLWHEISEKMLSLSSKSDISNDDHHLFFSTFVQDVESRISPMVFALLTIDEAFRQDNISDSIKFLETNMSKIEKASKPSQILLKIAIAQKYIDSKDLEKAEELLKETEKFLRFSSNLEEIIFAYFYRTYANLSFRKGDQKEFYLNALQFLAYSGHLTLTNDEKIEWARRMGMAVLISKSIYNIAELVDSEIIKSLKNSNNLCIYKLIKALNGGKIMKLKDRLEKFKETIKNTIELSENIELIRTKGIVLALLELAFSKQKGERNLEFSEIAKACDISEERVEIIAMKAMSLGLIKGEIDEISKIFRISWVIPRVLNMDQIGLIKERIKSWKKNLESYVKNYETIINESNAN